MLLKPDGFRRISHTVVSRGFRRILLEEFWALTDKTTIAAKKTIGKWNLIPPYILFLFLFGHRKPSKSAVKC